MLHRGRRMKPLEPRDRLGLIARAFRFSGEIVTREYLRAQYRYETGQEPESRDLDAVIRHLGKEVGGARQDKGRNEVRTVRDGGQADSH